MLFEETLKSLVERYGIERVRHHPDTGDVVIELPLKEASELLWPYIFTWQQAKYLSANPISDEDIRQHRFPPDWPS